MDRLLSQTNPTSVRSAIKNILRQSASEATEEGLTTLANTISDAIIMGDKSELGTAIRAYRASGYSDSDAQKKAFTDWLIGLAGDTIGGAVSGGLFAAGYNVPGGIAYKRSGGDANSQNNASSNVDHANPNVEANVEQNSNTDMDPLEFAVRETMKPSREQQAMDQALEDTANILTGSPAASNAEGLKPLQNANQEQISTFVNKSFENANNYQFLRISEVSDVLARVVSTEGIDINGYIHALRDNDIRHIRKQHGDLSNAKYPVTATDIENVRQLIDAPDNIYIGYPTKNGNDTIVYEKPSAQRHSMSKKSWQMAF